MNEVEYILSRFDTLFAAWKDARIVLHGTREYARAIIETFDEDFHFEASMSAEMPAGGTFCGKRIISEEGLVALHPDIVIMTERVRHAEAVYQDLGKLCADKGIALFDMYGLDWLATRAEIDTHQLLLLQGWLDLTEPYDVISIEVPNCLMMRRINLEDGSWERAERPLFKRLIEAATKRGQTFIYIGHAPLTAENQIQLLNDAGLLNSEHPEGVFFMREGEDGCWHEICDLYRGKKILHIGHGIPKECILPRYYGVDTYRILFSRPTHAGYDPSHTTVKTSSAEAESDGISLEALERDIAQSSVVSFDVFDTLLVRQTLAPIDVFALVEQRALANRIPAIGFAQTRWGAQVSAYNPSLGSIYDDVQRTLGFSDEQRDWLMTCELETEREVIIRREPVCDMFQKAVAAGKRVFLTSDMYLPSKFLGDLLESLGIRGYEQLLVSCEEGSMKQDYLLERLLSLGCGADKIIHIGDSWEHDVVPADTLGIRWVHIPTVQEIAQAHGFEPAIELANTLPERLLLGSCLACAFQDPFARRSYEPDECRFARLSMAPVVIGFMSWLFRKVQEENLEGVLFAARDGWVTQQVYRESAQSHPQWSLPDPTYFYTNRRAAFIPCSGEPRQLRLLLEKLDITPTDESYEHLMESFTGLPQNDVLPYEEGMSLKDYVVAHREAIARNASRFKTRYEAYLEKTLDCSGSKTYAFVDFVGVGTCQDYLEQWIPFGLRGLYFGRREPDERLDARFETYFQEEHEYLITNYMLLEHYLTSTEPSLEDFTEQGEPLFAQEVRSQDDLDAITRIVGMVLEHARWFFGLYDELPETISPALADCMFRIGGSFGLRGENYDDWGKHRI